MDFLTTARLPEKNIDISIIVPVYNARKYLCECLESLIKQTGAELEIFCIDDCSEDGSNDVLNEYASKDNRIQIIKLNENHGQAYARNIGLNKSNGKFVYFMDADDFLMSDNALSSLLEKMEKEEVDCLMFDAKNVYESEETRRRYDNWTYLTERAEEGCYTGMDYFCKILQNDVLLLTVWRQFWKRKYLIDNHLEFREKTSPHEDLIFWLESMLGASVYYWKRMFYAYRVRDDSSSMKRYDRKRLFAHFYCYYYGKRTIENKKIEYKYLKAIDYWFWRIYREIDENRISVIKNGQDINTLESKDINENLEYRFLIMNKYLYVGRLFAPEEYKMLKESEHILIYGAGSAGRNIQQMLEEFDIYDAITVVTRRDDEMDPEIRCIDEYINCKKYAVVIVGVTKKYKDDVMDIINRLGFMNVISLD